MEDRKTALAIFLCLLVILVYSELFLKPPVQQQPVGITKSAQTQAQTAPQAIGTGQQNPIPQQAPIVTETLPANAGTAPTQEQLKAAGSIKIESSLITLELTQLGGRAQHLALKEHSTELNSGVPLDLITANPGAPLPLGVKVGAATDLQTVYQLSFASDNPGAHGAYSVRPGGELEVKLAGMLPDGTPIEKSIIVRDDSYVIDVQVRLAKAPAGSSGVALEWGRYISPEEAGNRYDPLGFLYIDSDNDLENIPSTDITESSRDIGPVSWISVGDKYFSATLIAPDGAREGSVGQVNNTFYARILSEGLEGKFKVYVGPKHYRALREIGYQLHRSVDMGIFSLLAHPLMAALHILFAMFGNYGLAIIVLTLAIKLIFLPLTSVSFKSMKAMQDLQPEIKALRERIKDPTQLNQEMMALYKKRGVNPMGGCFPMLIQIPVFLGLYMGLLNTLELRHAPFALWINDLSTPESLIIGGVGVPVMIILMGLSMILQQWLTPSAMDPAQKKAMMLVPVIFTVMFIVFPFPAGLVLYWLTNNLISIVQQGCLRTEKEISPFNATIVSSVGLFAFGYILTLI